MPKSALWLLASLALFVGGTLLPPLIIDDGLSKYAHGIERRVAERSLDYAKIVTNDHPIPRLMARAYRVHDVRRSSEPCDGSPNMFTEEGKYSAEVEVYTFFGLPQDTFHMRCGGDAFRLEL